MVYDSHKHLLGTHRLLRDAIEGLPLRVRFKRQLDITYSHPRIFFLCWVGLRHVFEGVY